MRQDERCEKRAFAIDQFGCGCEFCNGRMKTRFWVEDIGTDGVQTDAGVVRFRK